MPPVSVNSLSDNFQDGRVLSKGNDFLELEIQFDNNVRLQRQFLLVRDDHFLFTADAILTKSECDIQYRSVMPLVDGVEFEAAEDTHEGFLKTKKKGFTTRS